MLQHSNKIRIIFFLPNFELGGAAESIVKLSGFLKQGGYSILVLSLGKNLYKKKLKSIGCEIIELNSSKAIFSILKIKKLVKSEISKNYFKLIFVSNIHYANIISIISCYGYREKLKLILTERSSLSELLINSNFLKYLKNLVIYYCAKKLYCLSDIIITNSKFEKKYILNNFKLKNVLCIHPASIEKIFKKRTKKKTNILKIIYVGRISEEKGVDLIIKALSQINKSINFQLNIYGDGNKRNEIKALINKFSLSKKVRLCGFETNERKIFKNADLLINASHFEGLPNAIVQAIHNNIFVICSNSPGGNLEVIKNKKFGFNFKNKNYKDLAKKIEKYSILRNKILDKEKLKHLEKYTAKYSFEKYINLFKKI